MAKVAEKLGTPLMPWQREVADIALEYDPVTKKLFYREIDIVVPRQSGKTTLLLVLMVHRALMFGSRQNISYTAQDRNHARKKWEDDHVKILQESPFKDHFRVRLTNGNEAILWKNGSKHGITAVAKSSGHGDTLDMGVIDEAFAQKDHRMEQAYRPAMITRPMPQLWVISTAGEPDSVYLLEKVDNGREFVAQGRREHVCYFEWSAPDDADPSDPEVWKACMPALGHTVTLDAVAAEFAGMKLSEFKRAYLNQWVAQREEAVISPEQWAACLQPGSAVKAPVAFAFDVAPDRSMASIAVAGMEEMDRWQHIEVVENDRGTGWLVDRIEDLYHKHQPIAIACDASGPASSIVTELEERGLEIMTVTTGEHAKACGSFYDAVIGRQLAHLDDPVLMASVDAAAKRIVSDSWLWSRRNSLADISPLVAATLARWAYQTTPKNLDPASSVW